MTHWLRRILRSALDVRTNDPLPPPAPLPPRIIPFPARPKLPPIDADDLPPVRMHGYPRLWVEPLTGDGAGI